MGNWEKDQSKARKRYDWGTTRGTKDPVWRDFTERLKKIPELQEFKIEKLGSEIHFWRQTKDVEGKMYWLSFLRFVGDKWDYWDVSWRGDDSRWRATGIKEVPVRQALANAVEFYKQKKHEFL